MDEDIHEEYIKYMTNVHMPEVMASGKFTDCHLLRLTEPVNEGVTYCAQYITDEVEKLADYRKNHSPKLQQLMQQKFGERLVSFRSVLEKR